MAEQKAYKFDKVTAWKTLKGGLIVGGGLAATYILEAVSKMDFGKWTPAVAGVSMFLINAIQEFISGEKGK